MTELFNDAETELAFFHHKLKHNMFDQISYGELLKVANTNTDFYKTAIKSIEENEQEIDLNIPRRDAWLERLEMIVDNFDQTKIFTKKLSSVIDKLSKSMNFSKDQKELFKQIHNHPTMVTSVTGRAGSGKSFVTSYLVGELIEEDLDVLVLAPTHVASTNINKLIDEARKKRFDQDMSATKLETKDKITLSTLTSWMFRLAGTNTAIAQTGNIFQEKFTNLAKTAPTYDLILVDEAYAANGMALLDLFLFAFYFRIPVFLIGDPNQIKSIKNDPKALFDFLESKKVLFRPNSLQKIERTKSQEIQTFSNAILNGDMNTIMKFDNRESSAFYFDSTNKSDEFLYENLSKSFVKQVLVNSNVSTRNAVLDQITLVPTNIVRENLSALIQQALLSNQMISDQYIELIDEKNHKLLKIHNGDVLMVMGSQLVHDWSQGFIWDTEKYRLRGATRIQVLDINPEDNFGAINEENTRTVTDNTDKYFIKVFVPDLKRELVINLLEQSSSSFNEGMFSPDIHELFHDLSLGYTATINKVQGLTISRVTVFIDKVYPHLNRNLIYSGTTRASQKLELVAQKQMLERILSIKE